jgi:multimeric flavodoxin WrbA
MTKVIAFNGSSRTDKGNTERLMAPFLDGMREAGAEVELFYTAKLDINDCLGEFHCWTERLGECIQRDQMDEITPNLREADIMVLGIPRYVPLPAGMQAFVNRLMPLVEPELVFKGGRTAARPGEGVRLSKMVLVSVSGWWEMENMDLVVDIVREMAADFGMEYSGALRRPHAYYMRGEGATDILEAARRCGHDLIAKGAMSDEDLTIISRPLVSLEKDLEMSNRRTRELKEGKGG